MVVGETRRTFPSSQLLAREIQENASSSCGTGNVTSSTHPFIHHYPPARRRKKKIILAVREWMEKVMGDD